MKYVLDTNTISYAFRGEGKVAGRLLATKPHEIFMPAVVLFELEKGALHPRASDRIKTIVAKIRTSFQVLSFDASAARQAGAIAAQLQKIGKPIGIIDTLIAATALSCGGILVTHNTKEFSRVPHLQFEDWY